MSNFFLGRLHFVLSEILQWGPFLLKGIFITLSIALCAFPCGIILGFLVALCRRSSDPSLQFSSTLYTTIFRSLPELLVLFLVYYGTGILLDSLANKYSFFPSFNVNRFFSGVLALSLISSAYICEIFLSAFKTIHIGQFEACDSLGLSFSVKMRKVIIPQLTQYVFPSLLNIWSLVLKDTSLVSVIGLSDLLYRAELAQRNTQDPFTFYIMALLIFLVLNSISSRLLGCFKNRLANNIS